MKGYYIDTCIWLNLFKNEKNVRLGIDYWKITEDFIDRVEESEDSKLIVSTIVLKELHFKLPEKFGIVMEFFRKNKAIIMVKTAREDYSLARKLETGNAIKIGFHDCLHIAISKRLSLVLVTRDRGLIDIAAKYIPVNKPENLIR